MWRNLCKIHHTKSILCFHVKLSKCSTSINTACSWRTCIGPPAPHQNFILQQRAYSSVVDATSSSTQNVHKTFFVNVSTDTAGTIAEEPVGQSTQSPEPTYADVSSTGIEYIPPPPDPAEQALLLDLPKEQILNALGEPTFSSLGLASWWPSGWMQSALEFIHVSTGLPWWATIAVSTVIIRMCVFPLVVKTQRNAAIMRIYGPAFQAITQRITEARNRGNHLEVAQASHDMQLFIKEKGIKPFQSALLPLAQAPVFISMFFALRGCANLPVESFKTGGLYWFTDLTVVDPYYILPIACSVTLLAAIELSADGGVAVTDQKSHLVRYFLRSIPLIALPFMINFPTALVCYWLSTNLFSLSQVAFLKVPGVREYFNIPKVDPVKSGTEPYKKKSFRQNIKEVMANSKVQADIRDIAHVDKVRFQKAGAGPVQKTYRYNPKLAAPTEVSLHPKSQGKLAKSRWTS